MADELRTPANVLHRDARGVMQPNHSANAGTDCGERGPSEGALDVLCISCSYSPQTLPTAIRAEKLLRRLAAKWQLRIITEESASVDDPVNLTRIQVSWEHSQRAFAALQRLRLSKFLELLVWPDRELLWAPWALAAGLRAVRARRPSAIVVFMMPYSPGLVGVALKRLTGLPLILNFDDSPTCSDMHPVFPSALHTRLAAWLENFYVRSADAVIYVSATTLARVQQRQPREHRGKFRLIRYGADAIPVDPTPSAPVFTIRYVGGFNGWHHFETSPPRGLLRRAYQAWIALGRAEVTPLDYRGSSPVFVGRAVKRLLARRPDWRGEIKVETYGNRYPAGIVDAVLRREGIADVVNVAGTVSNDEAMQLFASAEMLFLSLPGRPDGSVGGRISAKTYEYLVTDRPILAAVPPGENREFLRDFPGVTLCDPDDEAALEAAIERAAVPFFQGAPARFDRRHSAPSLGYDERARELERVVSDVVLAHRAADGQPNHGTRDRTGALKSNLR